MQMSATYEVIILTAKIIQNILKNMQIASI